MSTRPLVHFVARGPLLASKLDSDYSRTVMIFFMPLREDTSYLSALVVLL